MTTTTTRPQTMSAIVLMVVAFANFVFVPSILASNLTMTSPDMRPGCREKCSDEVKCVVEHGHCLHKFTDSKLVASHPTNFKFLESSDVHYKYIDLEWSPPDDGSFRDLTAFHVHVSFTSHDYNTPGQRGSQCYKVNIVDPQWIGRYSNMSVKFYLRCIRLALSEYMTIRVSIYSMPLNIGRPKLVSKDIVIKPEGWEPGILHWADESNNFNILVQNPYPDARFYNVTFFKDVQPRLTRMFERTFPAQHVEMKDDTDSKTVLDKLHRPHFLIKNLPANADYAVRIRLVGLYVNKSKIPNAVVITKPFTFNFTKRVLTTSPSTPQVAPVSDDSDAGVSRLVLAVIFVSLLFGCLFLILWKVRCQAMTCKLLVPSLSNNNKDLPKIIPVYCEENADFVRAVESHMTLLRRYVNVLPIPQFVGSRSCWCPFLRRDSLAAGADIKMTGIIIYLSPGLGHLLRQDRTEGLSRLDEFCHRILHSLQHHRRSNPREELTVSIVTFNCFQNSELDCLPDLNNMFSSGENGSALIQGSPIKLAEFKQNRWRLENLDQLLFHLCHVRDFPYDLPAGVAGWNESPEAHLVEQFLNRFAAPCPMYGVLPPQANGLQSDITQNPARLTVQTEGVTPSSPQSHPDRKSHQSKKDIEPGDLCNTSVTDISPYSSHDVELDHVPAAEAGEFYTSAKGNFYTKLPSVSTYPEKQSISMSDLKGQSVRYTNVSSEKNINTSDHETEYLNHRPQPHRDNHNHHHHDQNPQHDLDRPVIKPPPSMVLKQDNCVGKNYNPCEEEESESDNECFISSVESDTLLTSDQGRKENRSMKAISPPSSLHTHAFKDSISDLIAANNTTKGWNGAPFNRPIKMNVS